VFSDRKLKEEEEEEKEGLFSCWHWSMQLSAPEIKDTRREFQEKETVQHRLCSLLW